MIQTVTPLAFDFDRMMVAIEKGIHKVALHYPGQIWPNECEIVNTAMAKILRGFSGARAPFACSAESYGEKVAYTTCLDFVRDAKSRTRHVRMVAPLISALVMESMMTPADATAILADNAKALDALDKLPGAQLSALQRAMDGHALNGAERQNKLRGMTAIRAALGVVVKQSNASKAMCQIHVAKKAKRNTRTATA